MSKNKILLLLLKNLLSILINKLKVIYTVNLTFTTTSGVFLHVFHESFYKVELQVCNKHKRDDNITLLYWFI